MNEAEEALIFCDRRQDANAKSLGLGFASRLSQQTRMSCAHRCDPAATLQILKLEAAPSWCRCEDNQAADHWLAVMHPGLPSCFVCHTALFTVLGTEGESCGLVYNLEKSFSHRACSFSSLLTLCSDLASEVVVASLFCRKFH